LPNDVPLPEPLENHGEKAGLERIWHQVCDNEKENDGGKKEKGKKRFRKMMRIKRTLILRVE